jgi:transposase
LDRDHNAALNILRLGVVAQGALKQAGYGKAAPGNLIMEGIPR